MHPDRYFHIERTCYFHVEKFDCLYVEGELHFQAERRKRRRETGNGKRVARYQGGKVVRLKKFQVSGYRLQVCSGT